MKNPDQPWKSAAIGRYRSGDTIRTDRHRFTEYTTAKGQYQARMLYDHQQDAAEDVNIAERVSSESIVTSLTRELHKHMGKDSDIEARDAE
jgi:hypothetical protein